MSVMWDFGSCKNISPYKMEIDQSNFHMDVWEIQQWPYIILHKKDATIFNFQLSSKQHQAKKNPLRTSNQVNPWDKDSILDSKDPSHNHTTVIMKIIGLTLGLLIPLLVSNYYSVVLE